MLVKFKTKSGRVDGISFHPKRSWVLVSLNSGILLWDYWMSVCLQKYDGHQGPVRGIHFHNQRPIFVSGGDDCKIKVWNYEKQKCLFTLLGHSDYIRSTQFHHKYPWILSCSDDHTIHIWNWQSRDCICILTGHSHYVMSAHFHPNDDDLLLSASMDQTIRVWDISGIRYDNPVKNHERSSGSADIFHHRDERVRFVLEGHSGGVNCANFHPTLPLIISGGDDGLVKLWRMNGTKAWEVNTYHGHFKNVSGVLFHPRREHILSTSEDKSLRIWDMRTGTCIHTIRSDNDRFWALAAHPNANLFVAGHDSGVMLFKLERERPTYVAHGNLVYYVKEPYIRQFDLTSFKDTAIMQLRTRRQSTDLINHSKMMSYNPAENSILLTTRVSNTDASVELYVLPCKPLDSQKSLDIASNQKKVFGLSAVWISRTQFAVLDRNQTLTIRKLNYEVSICKTIPVPDCEEIFYAGTVMLLLRQPERMALFDIQREKILADVKMAKVKHVVWTDDMSHVALLAKNSITLCNNKLHILTTLNEVTRVKSGAWEVTSGVFIYNTSSHIKYVLLNGDYGIIRTLETPIYITKVRNNQIFCLDRDVKVHVLQIDPTEYIFKLTLVNKNYDEVMGLMRNTKLVGQAIIAHLHKKGYPEIAVRFVSDEKTQFSLALECGNLDIALESAMTLDNPAYWNKLAKLALLMGNHQVAEMCYRRTRNLAKLIFLYIVTGNINKLREMIKIDGGKNCLPTHYCSALLLGDVMERVGLLKAQGKYSLAYWTAINHDLTQETEEIKELIDKGEIEGPTLLANANLLLIPTPLYSCKDNWPILEVFM